MDVFATKGLFPTIRRTVQESLYVDKAASSQPAMLWWQGGAAAPDGLGDPGAWHLAARRRRRGLPGLSFRPRAGGRGRR